MLQALPLDEMGLDDPIAVVTAVAIHNVYLCGLLESFG
jgi:hypothetical protein